MKKKQERFAYMLFLSYLCSDFVKKMRFSDFWTYIKVQKWGKYVVAVLLFLAVFLFIGDQSLLRFAHRNREIRHLEEQRDMYESAAEQAQREIQVLQQPDSLERFAREQYFMHKSNEEIYLIEE